MTVFFMLSYVVWELYLRIAISPQFFSQYFFLVLLLAATYGGLTSLIAHLLPRKLLRPYMMVITFLAGFIYFSQLIYFRFFKVLYAVNSVKGGGQVMEFAGDIAFKVLTHIPALIFFMLPFIVVSINPMWRELSYFIDRGNRKKSSLITLASSLVLALAAFLMIALGPKGVNSAKEVLLKTNVPLVAADRVGLITAMIRDAAAGNTSSAEQLYLDDPEETRPSKTDPGQSSGSESVTPSGKTPEGETFGTDPAPTVEPTPGIVRRPQELGWIDFEGMAEREEDPNLKQMDLYFSQADPSVTNEKTGIYKGYNFIFITAESFSSYAIDPVLTPTLYMMKHQGYEFTNFYNPVWAVSTLDGEYSGLLGTIPKGGVWSMKVSGSNTMDYSPGHLFRREGYSTYAYHNHTWDYYARDISHPNLGYDYKGLGHGLEVKKTWPESDLEMMEKTIDEYIDKEPFHVYYLTVSGHMNYSFIGNMMASKNREYVENLDLSDEAKAYLACNIELDRAMEYLLKQLRAKGVADRTLIALNPDHYPYGLDKGTINELAGHEVEDNFELYHSSFLLYKDGMKPEVIDKPCCSLDCIATCYNMLGVPYDSRLLSGRDIFSPTGPLVMFMNRSWITDQGRYNALTGEFTPDYKSNVVDSLDPAYTAEALALSKEISENPEEYVKKMNKKVANRFNIAAAILDNDYYQYLRDMGYPPVSSKDLAQ